MNFTPEQVELIVQRVFEHLGTASAASALPQAPARSNAAVGPNSGAAVRLTAQVITHDLLAESVTGAATVRIGPKAILTPSARDFVKRLGIKIVREGSAAAAPTTTRWQALVTRSTPQIAAAVEGLTAIGINCDLRVSGTPAEAAAHAISALCRAEAQQAVVFTDQPELVACLANRNDRVRAAAASDAIAVERVRRHLQANLLALDPANRSVHELKTILKAFRIL